MKSFKSLFCVLATAGCGGPAEPERPPLPPEWADTRVVAVSQQFSTVNIFIGFAGNITVDSQADCTSPRTGGLPARPYKLIGEDLVIGKLPYKIKSAGDTVGIGDVATSELSPGKCNILEMTGTSPNRKLAFVFSE